MIDLPATFKKFEDEYLKFGRVAGHEAARRDLFAFCLLDRLCPAPIRRIVSSAGHDEIWLATDVDALALVATEDDILTLVRCGVRYDDDNEALCMFV